MVRFLLHSGQRHLYQAGWLSARRHHVQWRHLRSAAWSGDLGVGNRYRDSYASRSRSLSRSIPHRHEYGVVRTSARPIFSSRRWAQHLQPEQPRHERRQQRSVARFVAAVMSRLSSRSSSSPASPSVSPRQPMRRPGMVIGQQLVVPDRRSRHRYR